MGASKDFFESSQSTDYLEFLKYIEEKTEKSHSSLSETLYADLPDFRVLKNYKAYSADGLIDRYNCAQIQGLLIRSKRIKFKIYKSSKVEKRRLIQKLRFLGLMADISVNGDEMVLEVSGPMSIFDGANAYGLKIANFFPYILLFQKWSLEADVEISRKRLSLEVDSKKKISSHYKDFTGHIPEEYEKISLMIDKAKANDGWKAQVCEDFLNLGQESYCFPDMEFSKDSSEKVYMEIFHKWHFAELKRRLSVLEKSSPKPLVLAVQKNLTKKDGLDKRLEKLAENGAQGITIFGFPTAKAVLTQLAL